MHYSISKKANFLFFGVNIFLLLLSTFFFIASIQRNSPENITTLQLDSNKITPFSPEVVASMNDQADGFFTEGKYQNTIDIYLNIIAHNKTDYSVMQKLAHTYRYWNKYVESEKWFLKAIEINPNNVELYTDLGKLYRNMDQQDKAEAVFKKSIDIDPTYDLTYSYGLGFLYFDQKRFLESEQMFLKALELNPRSEMAHMGLGDLYREMGRYEESEKRYQEAFAINPQSESYLGLGWLYIHEKRYEEAVEVLHLYLKNIREKGEVYYTMGHAYVGLENFDKARNAFTRAVELNPDNPIFSEQLGKFNLQHPLDHNGF